MRDCPVCGSDERRLAVPDYIGAGLFVCECGMHYVDADHWSQEWFDYYYLVHYKTDDEPYSDARLNHLAGCVMSYDPRSVLDIGGMDGELQKRIESFGVKCDVSGVKDDNQNKYDIVVLSHTLEHIYDVPAMFSRILRNLGSRLIIEIPVWLDYENLMYDYHWQHINKFTKHHLGNLLAEHGFQFKMTSLPDYREYHCLRAVAWQLS